MKKTRSSPTQVEQLPPQLNPAEADQERLLWSIHRKEPLEPADLDTLRRTGFDRERLTRELVRIDRVDKLMRRAGTRSQFEAAGQAAEKAARGMVDNRESLLEQIGELETAIGRSSDRQREALNAKLDALRSELAELTRAAHATRIAHAQMAEARQSLGEPALLPAPIRLQVELLNADTMDPTAGRRRELRSRIGQLDELLAQRWRPGSGTLVTIAEQFQRLLAGEFLVQERGRAPAINREGWDRLCAAAEKKRAELQAEYDQLHADALPARKAIEDAHGFYLDQLG